MNLARIAALAHKEWREIVRDRLFLALAFVVPASLMIVFGYGLSLDVEQVPFAVVDHDRSALSRDYIHRFIDSRYFDYRGHVKSERELDPLLADSRIRFAIVIPPQFEENLMAGRPAAVQSLIDGTFLEELWGRVLALALYAAVLWLISFALFHKRPRA